MTSFADIVEEIRKNPAGDSRLAAFVFTLNTRELGLALRAAAWAESLSAAQIVLSRARCLNDQDKLWSDQTTSSAAIISSWEDAVQFVSSRKKMAPILREMSILTAPIISQEVWGFSIREAARNDNPEGWSILLPLLVDPDRVSETLGQIVGFFNGPIPQQNGMKHIANILKAIRAEPTALVSMWGKLSVVDPERVPDVRSAIQNRWHAEDIEHSLSEASRLVLSTPVSPGSAEETKKLFALAALFPWCDHTTQKEILAALPQLALYPEVSRAESHQALSQSLSSRSVAPPAIKKM